MARSTYIYMIESPSSVPLAAFTVKYELIFWARQRKLDHQDAKGHTLVIFGDGTNQKDPREVDLVEWLATQ